MPISFPNASRSYYAARNAVCFWGHDQSMEASFFISADALRQLMPGAAGNERALLEAFDRNCARIHAAAARIYGGDHKGGSFELNPSDFAP
jgi:Protein of unknown function (DUF1488)